MQDQFTPAPWPITFRYDAERTYTPFIIVGPAQVHFTQGYDVATDPERKARAEADARLIAEAPAMLAALREALPMIRGHQETPERKARYERVRAILARIDGEA